MSNSFDSIAPRYTLYAWEYFGFQGSRYTKSASSSNVYPNYKNITLGSTWNDRISSFMIGEDTIVRFCKHPDCASSSSSDPIKQILESMEPSMTEIVGPFSCAQLSDYLDDDISEI